MPAYFTLRPVSEQRLFDRDNALTVYQTPRASGHLRGEVVKFCRVSSIFGAAPCPVFAEIDVLNNQSIIDLRIDLKVTKPGSLMLEDTRDAPDNFIGEPKHHS